VTIIAPSANKSSDMNFCDENVLYDLLDKLNFLIITVTGRVNGYTRFFGRNETCERKRFRPHKVFIFFIRVTSRVDL